MTEKNSRTMEGIDENTIFQHLWHRRTIIIIITLLSTITGVAYLYLRTPEYLVSMKLEFKNANSDYINNIIRFGGVDFSNYSKVGEIESADSLCLFEEDKQLLYNLKDKISFSIDLSDCCIVIKGETTDTTALINDLNKASNLLQKNMSSLAILYVIKNEKNIKRIKNKTDIVLKDSIKKLITFLDKAQGSKDIDLRVDAMYTKYEYESIISVEMEYLYALQKHNDFLNKITTTLSVPQVKLVENKLDSRPLLMRWMLLGFAGACICVLLYGNIQSLIKKN